MREKLLKIILVILLLITMTMANFILIGVNCYTYAVDTINQDKVTNNKNVEFMSYFKNDKGDILSEYDVKMDAIDLKLYFKVIVKKEGYFNGNVTVSNANFMLVQENTNNDIAKIEGNKIYLNQINVGEEKEFEIGIKLLKDDKYQIDMLDRNIDVTLDGIYRDSKQKDIKVNGTRNVKLNIVNPYKDNLESPVILEQKVITNKLFEEAGQKKRILQMQIETGLANNLYPVKNLKLEINVPSVKGNKPNKVEVITPEKLMMTDKKIEDSQITYDEINGVITLNIENVIEEGKANWEKAGSDKFIVTYVFDGENKIEEQNSKTKAQYNLFDINNSRYNKEIQRTILSDEIDSIVELKVDSQEKEIYKGKIYSNIERSFVENLHVQVNALEIATGVKFEEDFGNTKLNIESKGIRINKNEVIDLLGQDGKVIIKEKTNNNVLAEINKSSKENEKGEIIIAFPENIKEIVFETSKPQKIGTLNIDKVNVIKMTDKNMAKNESAIEYKVNGKYLINDIENPIDGANNVISLKESETSARLEINKEELSTMVVNKNVEIRAILETTSEKNDLYKNPNFEIIFPEKIKEIKLNSINLINAEGLVIKNYGIEGKKINIEIENEQKKYRSSNMENVEILLLADLTIDKKEKNSTEQIKLKYTNENVNKYKNNKSVGEEIKDINIVSYEGVINISSISDYGIEVVNNQGIKNARLELGKSPKKATTRFKVINNENKNLNNFQILGIYPTKDATNENNIETFVNQVRVLGIPEERIKIYYTENKDADKDISKIENGWKENLQANNKVKKYLIMLDQFNISEEFNFEYDVVIPENLGYNQNSKQGYNLYYNSNGVEYEQKVENELLTLETGKGPEVQVELKATVGGEDATKLNKVKKGEIVHYDIHLKNIGTKEVANVVAQGDIPKGTCYIEKTEDIINDHYKEVEELKNLVFDIEKIDVGEEIIRSYDVEVKDASVGNIENKILIKYGEVKKESNLLKLNVEDSKIKVNIFSSDDIGTVYSDYQYKYLIKVSNICEKKLKNLKLNIKEDGFKIQQLFYMENEETTYSSDSNINEITVKNLKPGETLNVALYLKIEDFNDVDSKNIKIVPNIMLDDVLYRGNCLNKKVIPTKIKISNESDSAGKYVKSGDEITYKLRVENYGDVDINNLRIEEMIAKEENLQSILYNNQDLKDEEYYKINQDGKTLLKIDLKLAAKEIREYTIKTKITGADSAVEVSNVAKVFINATEKGNSEVKFIVEPDINENYNPSENNENVNNENINNENGNINNENGNNGNVPQNGSYIVSGVAWLDNNYNDEKDSNDDVIKDMKIKILDVDNKRLLTDKNGQILELSTNENGFYSYSELLKGKYIFIFEYDTEKYDLVQYEKQGVIEQNNSNVINKNWTDNGSTRKVACTDILTLNSNISNINIGLKEKKVFDMKLDKYVSRIVVNSANNIKTYELGEVTLGKADINAKQINNTNVVVEYKIRVTNEGEIPGYIKKIEDRISKDYKFNSEMNKSWYKEGANLVNTSLANTKIEPGESKELTLIMTKQMTENNTGLINNTAEIVDVFNNQGVKDIDSTPGNNIGGEDDIGSADVILGIKTGEIVMTVLNIVIFTTMLSIAAYFIIKKIMREK